MEMVDSQKDEVTGNECLIRKLLTELYVMPFHFEDDSSTTIDLNGSVMITLQEQKELKALVGILDSSQQVFLRTEKGKLIFYRRPGEMPIIEIYLIDGNVHSINGYDVCVDDSRGNKFTLHFEEKYNAYKWKSSLQSHMSLRFNEVYCHPNYRPITTFHKVVMLDVGGTSIRAGLAMCNPTLPVLYFPSISVLNPDTGKRYFGFEAVNPENLNKGDLTYPFCHSRRTESYWNMSALTELLQYVLSELRVEPPGFTLLLITSLRMTATIKRNIANVVLKDFNFEALHVSLQSASSMAGYKAKTGLLIEMGHKVTLTAFCEGRLLPGTEHVNFVGGPELLSVFKRYLIDAGCKYLKHEISNFVVRYIMERQSKTDDEYNELKQQCKLKNQNNKEHVDLLKLFENLTLGDSSLKLDDIKSLVVEGLFEPEVWMLGEHIPSFRTLIDKCLSNVHDDIRLEVVRSVYLAGGLISMSGVSSRVESIVHQVAQPLKLKPIVHVSEYSLHMSYLGAHAIASSSYLAKCCVTSEFLDGSGDKVFDKWSISTNY